MASEHENAYREHAPWKRDADKLADEVQVLVVRKVIDARSPAGDALLDYRNPPQSPRGDRLVTMEAILRRLLSYKLEQVVRNADMLIAHRALYGSEGDLLWEERQKTAAANAKVAQVVDAMRAAGVGQPGAGTCESCGRALPPNVICTPCCEEKITLMQCVTYPKCRGCPASTVR